MAFNLMALLWKCSYENFCFNSVELSIKYECAKM